MDTDTFADRLRSLSDDCRRVSSVLSDMMQLRHFLGTVSDHLLSLAAELAGSRLSFPSSSRLALPASLRLRDEASAPPSSVLSAPLQSVGSRFIHLFASPMRLLSALCDALQDPYARLVVKSLLPLADHGYVDAVASATTESQRWSLLDVCGRSLRNTRIALLRASCRLVRALRHLSIIVCSTPLRFHACSSRRDARLLRAKLSFVMLVILRIFLTPFSKL